MKPIRSETPQLAPPGAGIPWLERAVGGLMLRWQSGRTTRVEAARNFAEQRAAILELAVSCGDAAAARRVLIKRLPGLEDSSRYWSVFMTLDHLRIVNDSISEVIGEIANGRHPGREASTAAVKPDERVGPEVVEAFDASCSRLARVVAGVPDLATPVRFAHPWFGPMDAATWHFMAGFHMNLHRKQILSILAGQNDPARDAA